MGSVAESLQRRLAGISGGGHQDHDLPAPCLGRRNPHEMGQDLKRHVLESAGRSVPQLEDMHPFLQGMDGGHGLRTEGAGRIGRLGTLRGFLLGEIGEKTGQDRRGPFGIRQRGQGGDVRLGHARQFVRYEKAPVPGNPLDDGLGGRYGNPAVPGAVIHHGS